MEQEVKASTRYGQNKIQKILCMKSLKLSSSVRQKRENFNV